MIQKKCWIPSSSGNYQIPAILTLPKAAASCPAVLLCHGTGSNKDEAGNGYVLFAQALAEAGIASLRFDFIGTGESTVNYIEYHFKSAQRDIDDCLAFLAQAETVDMNRIGIVGWSQGGTMAMLAAARCRQLRSVVLWAGAPSLRSLIDDEMLLSAKQVGYYDRDLGFGDPIRIGMQWIDDVLNTDILACFHECQAPVLAIAGSADTVVAPSCAQEIVRAASNSSSSSVIIEGADHCFNLLNGELRAFEELMAVSIDWLKKTL